MENIRVKLTIRLNGNHALSEKELEDLKPAIGKEIATCLPESIYVDKVDVTSVKDGDRPAATGLASKG